MLDFIEYSTIKDTNKEFLRNDLWDLEFTVKPNAVYFPGDLIIRTRLISFDPGTPNSLEPLEHNIRGFQIKQRARQKTDGSMTLTFVDREDHAISYFIQDWFDKISDRATQVGVRKEDYVAEIKYTIYNSSRVAIKELIFHNCMPADKGLPENGTSDVGSNSEVTLNLDYEHYERTFLNAP